MESKGIAVVGSIALDTVETTAGKVCEALGGSAVYFSVAASIFSKVNLIAVVGEDFPEEHVNLLKSKNVDLEGLKTENGKTFRWEGLYEGDMNSAKTLKTELNVFEKFNPVIPDGYRNLEHIFLANIDPELQLNVLTQFNNKKFVVCDTMNLWINTKFDALMDVFKRVNAVLLNDGEARSIAKENNLIKAAKKIREIGPDIVIVKKGEHGAFMVTGDDYFTVPAYPVESVVDPTGAGDSFAGGFMGYVCSSGERTPDAIKRAMVFGTVIASFTVEKFSVGRLLELDIENVKKRYEKIRETVDFFS